MSEMANKNIKLRNSLLLASKLFLVLVIIGFFLPVVGITENGIFSNGPKAIKVNNAINQPAEITIDVTLDIKKDLAGTYKDVVKNYLAGVEIESEEESSEENIGDYSAIVLTNDGKISIKAATTNKQLVPFTETLQDSIPVYDDIVSKLSAQLPNIKAEGKVKKNDLNKDFDAREKASADNKETLQKIKQERREELKKINDFYKGKYSKYQEVISQVTSVKKISCELNNVPRKLIEDYKKIKSGLDSILLFGLLIVSILSIVFSLVYLIKALSSKGLKREPAGLNIDFTVILIIFASLLLLRNKEMFGKITLGVGSYLIILGIICSLVTSIINVICTPKNYKKEPIDTIFDHLIVIVLTFVVIVTVYPFWNTIAVSFNDGLDSIKGGITFWPRKFTWANYKALFITDYIFKAGIISVTRTIIQTIGSVFCTCLLAYALSRKEFVLKKSLTTIIVISMYVSAGLIPGYLLIKKLHLLNNYLVYIVPSLVDVFNFILVRTYINGLPDSFVESARIDGANEFKIFTSIIFPLIVPSVAMICLFVAVGAWNSWFDTYLYASGEKNLHSLQYVLMSFLQASQSQSKSASDAGAAALAASSGSAAAQVTPIAIRASITMIATIPILVVYPFVQKYFVVGMTIGGVKE